jgi:hypothetical protein
MIWASFGDLAVFSMTAPPTPVQTRIAGHFGDAREFLIGSGQRRFTD